MTTQTTLLSYTVVFSLVFTVLYLVYLIRDGRLFEGGAYLKFCAKGWALIRGRGLLERGRLFEEIRYIINAVCFVGSVEIQIEI